MKKVLITICCATLVFAGCKEHDTPIIFSAPAVAGTYKLASAPGTQPHNVLVEEFTGQSCPNCPAAHAQLDAIAAQPENTGRINIVSLYFTGGPQTVPPTNFKYDLRDSFATTLSGSVLYGGISALPSAGIDRTPYQGNLVLQGSALWSSAIATQESIIDSVNLSLSSSYNSTTGVATITDTVTYTQNVATQQNVSIYIVEDSLIDIQEDNTAASGFDNNYLFLDVFRAMVATPYLGDGVLDSMAVKPAGQVYWRKYTFATAGTKIVNTANCRVIAFISNSNTGGDYRVLQSVQCPLVP